MWEGAGLQNLEVGVGVEFFFLGGGAVFLREGCFFGDGQQHLTVAAQELHRRRCRVTVLFGTLRWGLGLELVGGEGGVLIYFWP